MPISDEQVAQINAIIQEKTKSFNEDEQKKEEVDQKKQEENNENIVIKENEEDINKEDIENAEQITKEIDEENNDEKTGSVKEEVPAISDYALTEAVRVGLSLAEARQFSSDSALLKIVQKIKEYELESKRKQEDKKAEPEKDLFENFPELNPDEYGPDVLKVFDAFKDIVRKQNDLIKELKSDQDNAATFNKESAAKELTSWFDLKINELGIDFEETLGKGPYGGLKPGSSQLAKRDAIADQLAVLMAGYNASGIQAPPRDELFDVAASLVLADDYQKIEERKLSDDLARRSKQHINRAGGNNVKSTKSPEEEVADLVQAKIHKLTGR